MSRTCLIPTPAIKDLAELIKQKYPQATQTNGFNDLMCANWVGMYIDENDIKDPLYIPKALSLVNMIEKKRNMEGKSFLYNLIDNTGAFSNENLLHEDNLIIYNSNGIYTEQQNYNLEKSITNNKIISETTFTESSGSYAQRTKENASADATIALATDFNSAGEKLTKSTVKAQNKKYIAIDANNLEVTQERVDRIVSELNSVNAKTLNIAGNGIYTMKGKYTLQQINDFTYELLKAVVNSPKLKNKIESIRSGGQTGFDEAGIIAALRLGILNSVNAPKGWKFRNAEGKDISDEQEFKKRFLNLLNTSKAEINIYAGNHENEDLSNLANRPFYLMSFATRNGKGGELVLKGNENPIIDRIRDILNHSNLIGVNKKDPIKVKSVENLFQALKVLYGIDEYFETVEDDDEFRLSPKGKELFLKILNTTPKNAKHLGGKNGIIKGLTKLWDKDSSEIMKQIIYTSFLQNEEAANRLISTGNTNITHKQDKTKWNKEFPKVLMEVRTLLAKDFGVSLDIFNLQSSANYNLQPTSLEKISPILQEKYNRELKNSEQAVKDVMEAVSGIKRTHGIEKIPAVEESHKGSIEEQNKKLLPIFHKLLGLDPHGRRYANEQKGITIFTLNAPWIKNSSEFNSNPDTFLFVNPFNGLENALLKFIQWIMPNDFLALPKELLVEQKARNDIRTRLAKSNNVYLKRTIYTDGTSENFKYAVLLKYIIDNFVYLREKYNPISDSALELSYLKHKVVIKDDNSYDYKVSHYSLQEDPNTVVTLSQPYKDDNGNPRKYFEVSFPDNFNSLPKNSQNRLFKSITMSVPIGYDLGLPKNATDEDKSAFNKLTEIGYSKYDNIPKRIPAGKQKVIIQKEPYRRSDPYENPDNIYMYGEGKTARNTKGEPAPDANGQGAVRPYWNGESFDDYYSKMGHTIPVFVMRYNNAEGFTDARFTDDDFDEFKGFFDHSMKLAQQWLDRGKTIVIPEDLGLDKSLLYKSAPKCYTYLQQRINELTMSANKDYYINKYLRTKDSSVNDIDKTPYEDDILDTDVLEDQRVKLKRLNGNEKIDAINMIADMFIEELKNAQYDAIEDAEMQLAAAESNKDKKALKRKLLRLKDFDSGLYYTLSDYGIDYFLTKIKNTLKTDEEEWRVDNSEIGLPISNRLSVVNESFDVLFSYATTEIESKTNIRIIAAQGKAIVAKTQIENSDNDDDPEGKKSTGNDGWAFNIRLQDPSQSLSANMRLMLSSFYIKDEDGNIIRDSFWREKHYNGKYVYEALTSLMAKELHNDIDKFMYIIPKEKLNVSEEERSWYPYGKAVFPILQKYEALYPFIKDIEVKLESDYSADGEGQLCSQFFSNFNLPFNSYAIKVDEHIINENSPTGDTSLKKSVITNYEGGVLYTGKGIHMIYNANGEANKDNIVLLIDKIDSINKAIEKTRDRFYKDIEELEYFKHAKSNLNKVDNTSIVDAYVEWQEKYPEHQKIIQDISDVARSMGINFSAFDVFRLHCDKKAGDILTEGKGVLNALLDIPSGEHLINSSTGGNEFGSGKVSTEWNHLFKHLGEFVTDTEFQSNFRHADHTQYSYVAPNKLTTLLGVLSSKDAKERKAYMDKNYKPFDWFYDSKNDKWRTRLLEWIYDNGIDSTGHDILSIKGGWDETEYADWTANQIYDLFLTEYYNGTGYLSASTNLVLPILSDSQICKVYPAINDDGDTASECLRDIAKQEISRIKVVLQRKILLSKQTEAKNNYEEALRIKGDNETWNKLEDTEREKLQKDIDNYEQIKDSILEIQNWDKNGDRFCFMPELNDFTVTVHKNNVSQDIINLCNFLGVDDVKKLFSSYKNQEEINRLPDLYKVVVLIEHMNDEDFNKKINGVYGELKTKETFINEILQNAVDGIIKEKFEDWAFEKEYGKLVTKNGYPVIKEQLLTPLGNANKSDIGDWLANYYNREANSFNSKDKYQMKEEYEKAYMRLKIFYSVYAANTATIIELLSTDMAFFKNTEDFAKRWKAVYGAGKKLNTMNPHGKRIEGSVTLKDIKVRRSRSIGTIKDVLNVAVNDGRITKLDKEVLLNKFVGINGVDAQAYRSLDSYVQVLQMLGLYSTEVENAVKNLKEGTFNMEDFYVVFQTLKPFTFSTEAIDSGIDDIKLKVPVYHKNSEAVLFAIYSTLVGSSKNDANYSARLRGMNRIMNDVKAVDEEGNIQHTIAGEEIHAIDIFQFESAVKMGGQGIVDINFSPNKLQEAQIAGQITVGNKSIPISRTESYYDIAKKLNNMTDEGKLTEDEYNELMDSFEPTEDEVYDIINHAIHKNGDLNKPFNNQVLHQTDYADYCIQQPTPNHLTDVKDGTLGSQLIHIGIAEMPEDIEITIDTKNGKRNIHGKDEIRRYYNSLFVANILEKYNTDIENLFNDKERPAIFKLRDRLMPIVMNTPKYGKQMIDALQIVKDPYTGKMTFAMPLNNINVTHQLEELITSLFKNSITKQTINGGNAILAADIGYADSLKIVADRDEKGNIIKGTIKGIECYLPASSKAMFSRFLKEETVTVDGKKVTRSILDIEKLHKAGLDKAIGYRIPTEGLYSAMPLIIKGFLPQQNGSSIVVAQEVTLLTGSDNDVDKMYLMLKNFSVNGDTNNINIVDSVDASNVLNATKEERDNTIIDIMYNIITNQKMSDKWLHPGNYDNLRLYNQSLTILSDPILLYNFKQENNIATDEEAINILRSKPRTAEELKAKQDNLADFMDKYKKPKSPIYPETFVSTHKLMMAGVAEKGIFANNTINHAKLQWTPIKLTDAHTFTIDGYRVQKVDPIEVEYNENGVKSKVSVGSECAECSAASVDNGKDPILSGLNITAKTAPLFGYMERIGVRGETASALLHLPLIAAMIDADNRIDTKYLNNFIKKIGDILNDLGIDVTKDSDCDWHTYEFTTQEFYRIICDRRSIAKLAENKNIDMLKSLYRAYSLVSEIYAQQQNFREPQSVLHHDSPTHAADTSFGGVIAQTKVVEDVNDRKYEDPADRYFEGDDDLVIYGLKDGNNSQDRMNAIMDTKLPITQAFYTYGIEKIKYELKDMFMFARPEIQKLVDRLWKYMNGMGLSQNRKQKIVSVMLKDYIVYSLSKTGFFGTNSDGTFDEKRQYYLYKFPSEFMKMKSSVPELNNYECIRRMGVTLGSNNMPIIILQRQGDMSILTRDNIVDSFEMMLLSDNEAVRNVAVSLMVYTYYLNGFEFSYMSFGNLMGTNFLRSFPYYIEALQNMQTEPITDEDSDRFFNQFLIKRNGYRLLPEVTLTTEQKASTLQDEFYNSGEDISKIDDIGTEPYIIITNQRKKKKFRTVYVLNRTISEFQGTICYSPMNLNTDLHYNAAQSIEEMASVVYDVKKEDNSKFSKYKSNLNDMKKKIVNNSVTEFPIDRVDQNAYVEGEPSAPNVDISSSALEDDNTEKRVNDIQVGATALEDTDYSSETEKLANDSNIKKAVDKGVLNDDEELPEIDDDTARAAYFDLDTPKLAEETLQALQEATDDLDEKPCKGI